MKYLITGGAGFIGSHLSEALLNLGNDVIIVDNLNDYYYPNIKKNNLKFVQTTAETSSGKLEFHICDIRDKATFSQAFDQNIDCVVHLAAMAGVRPSIANPSLYWEVNVLGTQNLLDLCEENGIKNIVFASSSSVYGNNKKVPFSEDDNVDNPISPYAATKKAGELMCHVHSHLNNANIACLRFFTVFGPRQRPDLAINKFVKLIKANAPIPMFGDGTTSRDYTYISDIVNGIIKSIEWVQNSNNFGIFNLGGDEPINLSNMIEIISEELNTEAVISQMPPQKGDVDRTFADLTKSSHILGYKPVVSFRNGIKNFIRWTNENDGEF